MPTQNSSLIGRGEWLRVKHEGVVAIGRIVAIGQVEAAPIRRLIQATRPSHVVVLTGGRKRKTVLVLDSGHVVITPLTVTEALAELTKFRQSLIQLER